MHVSFMTKHIKECPRVIVAQNGLFSLQQSAGQNCDFYNSFLIQIEEYIRSLSKIDVIYYNRKDDRRITRVMLRLLDRPSVVISGSMLESLFKTFDYIRIFHRGIVSARA